MEVRVRLLIGLIAAGVCASLAEAEPVSPQEFEALATGRTLHFTQDGLPFGAEQYFSGRRTLWRFFDGSCETGLWQPADDLICFTYDTGPDRQCWRLWREKGRLSAVLVVEGFDSGIPLDLARIDDADLPCPGPRVGS